MATGITKDYRVSCFIQLTCISESTFPFHAAIQQGALYSGTNERILDMDGHLWQQCRRSSSQNLGTFFSFYFLNRQCFWGTQQEKRKRTRKYSRVSLHLTRDMHCSWAPRFREFKWEGWRTANAGGDRGVAWDVPLSRRAVMKNRHNGPDSNWMTAHTRESQK